MDDNAVFRLVKYDDGDYGLYVSFYEKGYLFHPLSYGELDQLKHLLDDDAVN